MIITADSGSTKTTWKISDHGQSWTLTTQGINPFHMSYKQMTDIIQLELIDHADCPKPKAIKEIFFYGAGCTKEKSPILQAILQEAFPNATTVEVASDMLGAAKALFGNNKGIACILGTGANSCLYDGEKITANVSPMGYILGDEGSGAVLGRTFLNLMYKGNETSCDNKDNAASHAALIKDFEDYMGLTQPDIIQKVYREPMPNRFLASIAPYINKIISEKSIPHHQWVELMVIDCFRLFFRHNVAHYTHFSENKEVTTLPCSFVGSIAYYFKAQLQQAAQQEGFTIDKIKKEPLA